MFLYRDDYYNKDTDRKDVAEVIIAKQRNGPIGTVELAWLPQYTKFANIQDETRIFCSYLAILSVSQWMANDRPAAGVWKEQEIHKLRQR